MYFCLTMSLVRKSYEYKSPNFDQSILEKYNLTVFARKDYLVFALVAPDNKILMLKEFYAESGLRTGDLVDSVVLSEKVLREKFASAKVVWGTSEFSLIPETFYNDNPSDYFLRMIRPNATPAEIATQPVKEVEAMAIFSLQPALRKRLNLHFKTPDYAHFSSSLVRMANAYFKEEKELLLVHFIDTAVCILGMKSGKMHFCNMFDFRYPTDVLYFVELALSSMGSKGTEAKVYLTGEFESDSSMISNVMKLIPGSEIPTEKLDSAFDTPKKRTPSWKYAFLAY